jgi:hypothetical protein
MVTNRKPPCTEVRPPNYPQRIPNLVSAGEARALPHSGQVQFSWIFIPSANWPICNILCCQLLNHDLGRGSFGLLNEHEQSWENEARQWMEGFGLLQFCIILPPNFITVNKINEGSGQIKSSDEIRRSQSTGPTPNDYDHLNHGLCGTPGVLHGSLFWSTDARINSCSTHWRRTVVKQFPDTCNRTRSEK